MPAQISAIDSGQNLAATVKGTRRATSGNPFEELMASLTQATGLSGASNAATQSGDSTGASGDSTSGGSGITASQQSPIRNLEQVLRASGQPLENMQVSKADRGKLEKVLLQSGYRAQDVRQLLERSSNADGSINLAAMFANLSSYLPTEGPLLLIGQEDLPLLTQVLKDLGLDQDKVQQFVDGLTRQGDKVVLQGLPELLAQADPQQTKAVDQSVLSDLLSHLGLGQAEVQSLITRATDNAGNTTPPAVLALFTMAAQKQEPGLGQSLQDLAGSLKLSRLGAGQNTDAAHLRAQVIASLQKIEANVSAQTQSLSKQWQQALSQAQEALKFYGTEPGASQGANGLALALGQGTGLPGLINSVLQDPLAAWGHLAQLAQDSGQAQSVKTNAHVQAAIQDAQAAGAEGAASAATRADGETTGSGAGAQEATRPQASQSATQRPVERALGGELGGLATNQTEAQDATASRPVLPAYVARQVGQQIVQMVTRQEESLRLALKPPSLGEVSLELTVKDGVIKASIVTDTVAAKQTLENGLDQLKQQLTMQGLKVESVEITVNPDAQRQQTQAQAEFDQGRHGSGQRGQGGSAAAVEGLDSLEAGLAAAAGGAWGGNGRINLFA